MSLYWLKLILVWYLAASIIGWIFLPINSLLFKRFKDFGYPFSKVLGLAILSYLIFLLNFVHLIPFYQWTVWLVMVVILIINWYLYKRLKILLPKITVILAYELFFLCMFGVWTYLKGFEPSIHSLEKYMDFGFIQSILNSKYLPPQDIWFASTIKENLSINYYYFGHFVSALIMRITGIIPSVGYNLMLATIFGYGTTLSFSLGFNLFQFLTKQKQFGRSILAGALSMAIMNFGGNLQTIYLFTKGYVADNPVPFWRIFSGYNPLDYWYPNATRFIPFTIHEFPSYSYVVSDLHGHVLDIPFVLLIIALTILLVFTTSRKRLLILLSLYSLILGINYMTNATDFLVYGTILFFVLVILHDHLGRVLMSFGATIISALVITLPFSLNFKPFASSIGVNCAPDFLVKMGSLGPFLFEVDKCQTSPTWMLFILWGFFWLNFLVYLKTVFLTKEGFKSKNRITYLLFFVFVIGLFLTLFAEFFYFKDIYPAHFRANTMFKLGYQSFIMMSIASGVTIVYALSKLKTEWFVYRAIYLALLFPMLTLVLIYYQYAIPSYFGRTGFQTLDGSDWIKKQYPDSYQIIEKLNRLKQKLPVFNIVEAHGDSYSDFNLISAHTGIPTIIGWPVHEWLWRGTYDIVKPRADEVQLIYEGTETNLPTILKILKKYRVRYLVVAEMEKRKYSQLNYQKFYKIGVPVYTNKQTKSFLFKIND